MAQIIKALSSIPSLGGRERDREREREREREVLSRACGA
jgi:hypothetical protein